MSLEDHLSALTKAVEANTAALSKIAGAAKAATGTAGKSAGADAGAKPAATAAAKKPATPKAPTIDDIRTKFGGYLSTDDAELRAVRKEQCVRIYDHFGVKKATELAPENFAEALGYLASFENGEEPEFAQADDGDNGGGDDGDSLI
jgi:hypothetical protein